MAEAERVFNIEFHHNIASFETEFFTGTQFVEMGFENVTEVPFEKIERYPGPYTVIPAVEAQTLGTAQKLLEEDVRVDAIPYYQVSNDYGNTVIIGG